MKIKSIKNKIKTSVDKYSVYSLEKNNENEVIANEPIHFVQMYDRSGSMSADLRKLTQNIKETLGTLDEGDFLSVLWYSGRGQNGVVIEGHRVTKTEGEIDYLSKLLDKNNTTIGSTMYSEVINEGARLIDKYSSFSKNAAISFFTDGGVNDERKSDVIATIEKLVQNPNCMSFNTIGYGRYYDAEILKDMAAMSPQGQYFHNSKIEEYLDTYKEKVDMNKGFTSGSIEVKNLDEISVDVYLMTDKSSSVKTLKPNESITFKTTKTDMSVISNGLISIDVKDGDFKEVIKMDKDYQMRSVDDESKETMLYGMASALYQVNRRDDALDILEKEVRDLQLYNKLANAFTTLEVGTASEFARTNYLNEDLREVNTINGPISEGISIMKILTKAEELSLDFDINEVRKDYKSISAKSEVTKDLFVESNSKSIIPISEIKFNTKGKLNASVLLTRNGYLDLSEIPNKPSELDDTFITKRYNNYNIIQDGVYRGEVLPLIAKNNHQLKELKTFLEDNNVKFSNKGMEIKVDMEGIPMITRNEARKYNTMADFSGKYLEAEVQKLETYVLKQVLDILKKEDGATKGEIKTYSEDTKSFLKEIGISYDGSYAPTLGDKIPMTDKFEYKVLNFELNGLKTTNGKISEYYNYEPEKRVSQVKLILNKCYNEVRKDILDDTKIDIQDIVEGNYKISESQELFDKLNPIYVEEKSNSSKLSKEVDTIRFGKVLTGSFFEDLKQDDKGQLFVEYTNKVLGEGKINVSMSKIIEGGEPIISSNENNLELTR